MKLTPQYSRSTVFPYFDLDHIQPLHLGGGNNEENLQVLCKSCPREKTREENKAIYKKEGKWHK